MLYKIRICALAEQGQAPHLAVVNSVIIQTSPRRQQKVPWPGDPSPNRNQDQKPRRLDQDQPQGGLTRIQTTKGLTRTKSQKG